MKKNFLILGFVLLITGAAALIWFPRHSFVPPAETPVAAVTAVAASLLNDTPEVVPADTQQTIPAGTFVLSEPAVYKNLQVFCIYSGAEIEGERYITLDDALKSKLAVVRETGEVNALKIDNRSTSYIYINSGDIVRGGKQDRTIQFDVVIAPGTRNVNLASFCVESNRWSNRGEEKVELFSSSKNSLSSTKLKVAAKVLRDQGAVWENVSNYQSKASENMAHTYGYTAPVIVSDVIADTPHNATARTDQSNANALTYDVSPNHIQGLSAVAPQSHAWSFDVRSDVSSSSLELTLENKEIKNINAEYRKHILEILKDRKNAVGIACFINGKLTSIDIYNNYNLFEGMFDKLLDAAIAEAISEDAVKKYKPVDSATVREQITKAAKVLSTENVNKLTRFTSSKTSPKVMLFTTDDREQNKWLHKNWLDVSQE